MSDQSDIDVIEHFFFIQSPFAYLGLSRLKSIATNQGKTIRHRPMDIGRIFPETGGTPLAKRPPARQAYRLVELERWRTYLGIPLNLEPAFFPFPAWPASGLILEARARGLDADALVLAIMRGCWAEQRNMGDEGDLALVLAEAGFDTDLLTAVLDNPELNNAFEAESEAALSKGVFGSPFYIWNGEAYFGQDRLDFLDRSLAAKT
ncbi:MAG: 2-hydroxychromene-2-carboxylate isomerase [Magnetovibrionaceae bacterium]